MPASLIALIIVLVLGIIFLVTYFAFVLLLHLFRRFARALGGASTPHSVRRSLRESKHYAKLIRETVQQCPPGPVRDRLNRTIKPVDEWLVNLNRLEQALAKLYTQRNLPRELRRVTSEIEQLRRQLLTADREESVSLRSLMESKKKQSAALKELIAFQNQAELKIRKIASDLGTTHTEMLLVTAKGDFNDNRIQRLDENLEENMTSLRDMLAAMDEMGYSSAATG